MRVGIRRVDPSLPLPEYHSPGAAAFDLYSRLDVTVAPGELGLIPSNLIVGLPAGYVLILALRSGTPRRKGVLAPGGVGVIDQDYRGPDDEIQIQVYNFSEEPVLIRRGERIAQGLLLPVARCEWDEADLTEAPSRGGFGSTG